MVLVGVRVLRGPDWNNGDIDGGDGHLGTIVNIGGLNTAQVLWDNGQQCVCRIGENGPHDLKIFDSGLVGVRHMEYVCSSCPERGIFGMRWQCKQCSDVNLCPNCYITDKHNINHPFLRFDTPHSEGVEIPKRSSSLRSQAMGIFPGAIVKRGRDWKWGSQDGGDGKTGKVLYISHDKDSASVRNVVSVKWSSTGSTNAYRLGGIDGKVDLMFVEQSRGPFYYRDHLPVCVQEMKWNVNRLGSSESSGRETGPGPDIMEEGDTVSAENGTFNKYIQNGRDTVEVTKRRGKVPPLEYTVLREHRVEMVNKLIPEKVIPYLKQNKVIDQDDVEKIERKCKDLRRKGAETMLDILYNSGKWAFEKLIAALQHAAHHEIAAKLTVDLKKKKAYPHSTNITKQRGRLSGLEYEVLTDNHEILVNELDSSVLKNHLFQNELIDEDDMERISKKEEELRKEGVEEMLNIIYHSGSNVFPKLLKSLDEAGYVELSSKLDSDLKQKKKERAIVDKIEKKSPEVTKGRGKIPLLEFTVLHEHRVQLVDKLDFKKIISHLERKRIINKDDVEKIQTKRKFLKQCHIALMLSRISDEKDLIEVLTFFKQAGYKEIAQKLTGDLKKKTTDFDSAITTTQGGFIYDDHIRGMDKMTRWYLEGEMVNMIYKSGANALPILLKSLADAGYDELSFKLDSDLKQKKKESADVGLKIELNLVSFPDYPFSFEIYLETVFLLGRREFLDATETTDIVSNWRKKITKWNDVGKSWCVTMNNWFKDHEFKTKKELEMVIKDWLLELRQVVDMGCLEIDKINFILLMTRISSMLGRYDYDSCSRTTFLYSIIFKDVIQDLVPDFLTSEYKKDFVEIREKERQRLLQQHRQVFEKLKDYLEGIIKGKQNSDLLPIDTESCELAGYFHSVVDDVRERWNELHVH